MNKAKLKAYAPQARKDFIAAITARAQQLGLSETQGKFEAAPVDLRGDVAIIEGMAWPARIQSQRKKLITRIVQLGYAQTMEAIAYNWFNRVTALRYMELHDYLGHGRRVVSSTTGSLPDVLTDAIELAQSGALPGVRIEKVTELKLAGTKDGELYKLLLVAQCNALSNAMPFLFERIDDETELLLPDILLRTDSIIAKLVAAIPEEDWQEVEIIGWLYQFYISEKKDEVIGKVVKSEDIPAATQLFTPNWIVQYLVQNSVGRLWLMANPQSTLSKEWPYYITPAEQTPEVQAQLDALIQTRVREDGDTLNPESITVLDPACGSGHILVVAYDVLKAIYLERGYQARAIPRLILEKNLFGLDIDDRAAQMAGFALLMKARADDRRLFTATDEQGNLQPPKLNVLALQESKGVSVDELVRVLPPLPLGEGWGEGSLHATITALVETFEHAKTFGSLIQIPYALKPHLAVLSEVLTLARQSGDFYASAAADDLLPLVQQGQVLAMQFDAVVANPPYMGSKYLTPVLKSYLKDDYKGFEKDLFSAFMIRDLMLTKPAGQLGFMSPFVWMFISSYEELREHFIESATLTSLIQLEYSGFEGAVVPICTFTLAKQHLANFVGSYVRLSEFRGADQQSIKTLEAIQNPNCDWHFEARPDDFKAIPGSPIAYWATPNVRNAFGNGEPLSAVAEPRLGMATGNNDIYLRLWFEVNTSKCGYDVPDRATAKCSGKKWFPYNKGGSFRRWFGNNEYLVNWENDGHLLQTTMHPSGERTWAHNFNLEYIFRPGVTWTATSSSYFAVRKSAVGFLFDVKGSMAFPNDGFDDLVLGFLASSLTQHFMRFLNPTIEFQPGNIASLPFWKESIENHRNSIESVVRECVEIAKTDWNAYEFSWDFRGLPWLGGSSTTCSAWQTWAELVGSGVKRMHTLEKENNQLFISAYGLQDELSPEVPESQITLARADREKDCQRLISYAIGCMMGRYSLDEPGLIYAHAGNVGFEPGRYATFPADADGIIPITDALWFADDAPSRIREFLLAVWGAETLDENMAWLAESLGKKPSETPDETIRRYIADKFFKDHLQTYKKRPIYWLFSSGKQGAFQALVYLHRYNESTLARMRSEYVVPLTSKIQSRIEMLVEDAEAANSTASRNKLNKEITGLQKKYVELLAFDEKLRHYADMRIKLDLDDGVKVNYGKFGDLLTDVKAITGRASDD